MNQSIIAITVNEGYWIVDDGSIDWFCITKELDEPFDSYSKTKDE